MRRVLAVTLAACSLLVPMVPAAAATTTASPRTVGVLGHGFGHGRGMGQYGALGYALDEGWNYHQILDHYYGGTIPGQAPAGTVMTVDLTTRDGHPTIVAQAQGLLSLSPASGVTCVAGTACAVMIQRTGPGTWTVSQGTACDGGPAGWKATGTVVKAPAIVVTATAGTTDNRDQMLQSCESGGTRWLRGDLWAVDTGTSQATVNHVPLESYVRGVVPNESPASWGTLGGGAGLQELEAQAVASRSYALAESYAPWAKTCDTTLCQVYAGRAFQTQSGTFTDLEGTPVFASSDQAVAATTGEIRVFAPGGSRPAGTPALTEFSSSTGGYTAGGTFPVVADAGDSTASNPNHAWTTQVATTSVEAAFGAGLGSLLSVQVTGRTGVGDLGGRVTTMTLVFTGGQVTTTGNAFAAAVGLRSNWFTVTTQPPPPTSAPAPPSPTPTPSPPPPPPGYDVLTADGHVYAFGGAQASGSLNAVAAGTSAVSIGETPGGYCVLAGDGGVYVFGGANWHGSLKGRGLNAPPFQLATTPDGGGYWIVAFDGGVFAFGDAGFHGSTGNIRLNQPIVGMAATADGRGYWLVARDGGVFSFGDARFHGSTGNIHLNQPIIAMTATPDGGGYWLLGADGGIFAFGDARPQGSLPGIGVKSRAAAIAASGAGYLVATTDGRIYGFGTNSVGGPAGANATSATVAIGVPRASS